MQDKKNITRRDFLKLASASALNLAMGNFLDASNFRSPTRDQANHPNIIILLFDTLSARHLSIHGYSRNTTPNLERFAKHANVYHRHYASGNFTTPGTASILTGTYPWTNRAMQQAGLVLRKLEQNNLFYCMNQVLNTFAYSQNLWAEALLRQFQIDIDTHLEPTAFSLFDSLTYDGTIFARDEEVAFRAFEELLFQNLPTPGSLYFSLIKKIWTSIRYYLNWDKKAGNYPRGIPNLIKYDLYYLIEQVFAGTNSQLGELLEPSFAYFHFFPPHEPYHARNEFVGIFNDGWEPAPKDVHPISETSIPDNYLNHLRREYDEFIANVDDEFGKIYDFLSSSGLLDTSYVIVTSDHGQLFERGVHGHVTSLMFEPLIHVPLIISTPKQQERKNYFSPTSCIDLFPTLLRITGQETSDWVEGMILPGFGGIESNERAIFSVEAKTSAALSPIGQSTIVMVKGDYKLIRYSGYPGYENVYELYNLIDDAEELYDLSETDPKKTNSMKEELLAQIEKADRPYSR